MRFSITGAGFLGGNNGVDYIIFVPQILGNLFFFNETLLKTQMTMLKTEKVILRTDKIDLGTVSPV